MMTVRTKPRAPGVFLWRVAGMLCVLLLDPRTNVRLFLRHCVARFARYGVRETRLTTHACDAAAQISDALDKFFM
jgi:hypothetical protein